ncbi:MAG: hypothetical protein HOG97_02350 [Candidatus Marinimicrobia bacterium]|nr:hypothetical protein [Candidatus Neomarinimicrobiota bacterium]
MPLIDQIMGFEGLLQGDVLTVDTTTSQIQIEFPGELDPQGIPDEIFNVIMDPNAISPPSMDNLGSSIKLDEIISALPSIEFDIPLDLPISLDGLGDCFPIKLLDGIVIPPISESIDFPIPEVSSIIDLLSIRFIGGHWIMRVENNFPFKLDVNFEIENNGISLYETSLLEDIFPYSDPISDTLLITDTDSTSANIYLNDNLNYSASIVIGTEQSGTDCSVPNLESSTPLLYICGDDISNPYAASDCNGEICDCNAIYYCSGNPEPNNTYIDSDCTIGTNINFLPADCNSNCGLGDFLEGWIIADVAEVTPELKLTFANSFTKIASIDAHFNGIDTSIQITQSLPGFSAFTIKGAKIGESTPDFPNQLKIEITNRLFADFIVDFNFNSFYDDDDNYLVEHIIVEPKTSDTTIVNFSDYLIKNGSNADLGIDSMKFNIQISVKEEDITLVANEAHEIEIVSPAFDKVSMSNLRLAYISAIADSLDFAPSESTPIEDMPTGFEGFELFDIQMVIDLYNQIGIPVILDFEISGEKTGASIDPVKLAANINTPTSIGDCMYETGDTARTIIFINRLEQVTYYYCGTDTTKLLEGPGIVNPVRLNYEEEGLSSFIDLMNFAPEKMEMNALAVIDGVGKLAPATNIWGTFEMIAPLGFIFRKDLTFMPDANMTTLKPFDRSTADQIDTALVSALLNVEIENSSPIGGDMALLISDSTYFPLYLDSLVDGNPQYDSLLSVFNDSLETDIAYTQYEILESDDNKALRIDFFDADDSLQFWIGRLFDLEFEGPDSVDFNTGFVNPLYPKINLNSMEIDTIRMGWLTEDDTHYMVPMITFSSTNGTPRTFQTSNFLHMKSFITMTLASKGLLGGSSEEDDE